MESEKKVVIIKKAIAELMEEEEEEDDKTFPSSSSSPQNLDANRHRQFLKKLLSELDEEKEVSSETEEIMKELKNVKRQNSITHYLLTAMILITLGWQLSEMSIILKIKHGFSNPFKSAAEMIKGFLGGHDVMKDVQKQLTHPTYLPDLKIPTFDDDDDDDE